MLDSRQVVGRIGIPLVVLSASIIYITYFTERFESFTLLAVYAIGFVAYLTIILQKNIPLKTSHLIFLALGIRCLLLPAIPNLSDDVYRFIWDGRLWTQGINPFAYLPVDVINQQQDLTGINQQLFEQLNSPEYFTIYPPVNQLIFGLAGLLFPQSIFLSILTIRLIILFGEAGTLFLLHKLLTAYKLPTKNVLIYALNPLVILELTGNLHFEGLALCFILLTIWLIQLNRQIPAAISMSLAICTKLLPLIFLPFFIKQLGAKRSVYFFLVLASCTILFFLPLLSSDLIRGMSESIGLYFQKFEFNASIYYLVRAIGFEVKGYNIIGTAGKWLAGITFLGITGLAYFHRFRYLPTAFMWALVLYLLLSTTVHPWYIIPLLAFGQFSSYWLPVIWSLTIFLSYTGYAADGFHENLWLTTFEYCTVFTILIREIYRQIRRKEI